MIFDENFLNKFSMIFSTSVNGMIGKNNKLLWHLPNDLKRFKNLTDNKIVIMGRKTYESLPNGPLPNRLNIIMYNDENFLKKQILIDKPNTVVVKLKSLQEVLTFIKNYKGNYNTDEIMVIGGKTIYNLFLPFINKLYLTSVDVEIDGDTKIPDIHKYHWEYLEKIENKKDNKHKHDYTFYTLKKIEIKDVKNS